MKFDIQRWCVLAMLCVRASGEGWRWPDGAESVRIDTKVRFVDGDDGGRGNKAIDSTLDISTRGEVASDEVPFRPATDTEGFYNRAGAAGRFPVRSHYNLDKGNYRVDNHAIHPVHSANTRPNSSEVQQYCKCVSKPDCTPRYDSAAACGAGQFLCCYTRPNQMRQNENSEFFNEIVDERLMRYPGNEKIRGPFPPPPGSDFSGVFGPGHAHSIMLGSVDYDRKLYPAETLRGGGAAAAPSVLAGPGGPTGIVGLRPDLGQNEDTSASAQRGVLIGPGGPVGAYNQRPILVGPGGPTGIIGPNRGGSQGILVGPGGPTGIVGPGYSRQQRPGLLVGPGGPTGIIGPGRQLLVGPGGPTGRIGPHRFFGN